MEKSAPATLPQMILSRIDTRSMTQNVLIVIGASLLIAASAQVAIPLAFLPVPMTLQPLALLLVGAALGSTRGTAAAVAYLAEGASGLPFFAGGAAGPAVLVGPTAGYLIAFPVAAWITGFASERESAYQTLRTVLAMAASLAVIHFAGWTWLTTFVGRDLTFVSAAGPFLLGDMLKIGIALMLLPMAKSLLRR